MGHGRQQNTGAAIVGTLLACFTAAGRAQTSVPQAMLRSAALVTVADAAPEPSTSVASALQQLAAQAAVIFTGSVSAVAPDTGSGAKVKFAVEQGVRGTASGSSYTMHVSAWAGGAERFYPGERALFLLSAPSVSGYSAPVMGERGIVPLSGDTLVGNLDLRWIATDVQRGTPVPTESSTAATQVHTAAVMVGVETANVGSSFAQGAAPATSTTASAPDVHAIARDLVLDLLRAGHSSSEQVR